MGAAHVERKQSKLSSGEEQPRCHLLAFSLSDVSPFSLHLSIFFFFCFFSSSSSCGQEAGVAAAAEAGVAAAAEAEAGAEAEADAIAIVMEWSSSAVFHGSRTAGPARSTARDPLPAQPPAACVMILLMILMTGASAGEPSWTTAARSRSNARNAQNMKARGYVRAEEDVMQRG